MGRRENCPPALSSKAPTPRMNVALFGGALREAARWDAAALDEIIPCGLELRPRAHAMEGDRRMRVKVGERSEARGVTAHALDRRTFRPRPALPIEAQATRSQVAFEVPPRRSSATLTPVTPPARRALAPRAPRIHCEPPQWRSTTNRTRALDDAAALDAGSTERIANSTLAGVITRAKHPHKAVAGQGHLR